MIVFGVYSKKRACLQREAENFRYMDRPSDMALQVPFLCELLMANPYANLTKKERKSLGWYCVSLCCRYCYCYCYYYYY